MPRASQTPAKPHWSLSAPPQPFMGLFTLIKAVIEVTSQDGGYCRAPITHCVSSIFPCQLPHKPRFSSACPAGLALLRFLSICAEGDLSEQKGSVSVRFTHKSYWWLLWGLVQQVISIAGRCQWRTRVSNEATQRAVVVLINMLIELITDIQRVIMIIYFEFLLIICHLRSIITANLQWDFWKICVTFVT